MNNETLFVIDKKDELGEEFSKLVSMMNYTRWTTLQELEGLTVDELDYLYDDEANSIGMLLAHMVAVEKAYQIQTFENRDITEDEMKVLSPALELGAPAREQIIGRPVEYYVTALKETRQHTIDSFKKLPDSWLFEQQPFWWDLPANNYFQWFHVLEDELSHRGQIRIIKKMMSKVKN
ncbi:putative damage-inducible protein DinB [Sporosarcina luteola]|nr:putative damage-inducible protein DinB [Sporosarcina luteola]